MLIHSKRAAKHVVGFFDNFIIPRQKVECLVQKLRIHSIATCENIGRTVSSLKIDEDKSFEQTRFVKFLEQTQAKI